MKPDVLLPFLIATAAHLLQASPSAAGQPSALPPEMPAAVVEVSAAAVSVVAGGSRWQGFFVGPGVVLTSAVPLSGRAVVQLVTSTGRSGLGQVVATDGDGALAVLRVHVDLSPAVFIAVASPSGPLPSSAFLISHGDQGPPQAERVRVVAPGAASNWLVDLVPPPGDAVLGAPCLDVEGRLVGVVARAADSAGPGRLAVSGERLSRLLNEARRGMEAAAADSTAPRAPAPGSRRDEDRPAGTGTDPAEAESETDRRRREGVEAFDREIGRLLSQRDDVIRLQARYDVACVGTYVPVFVPGTFTYSGILLERSELPECKALQEQIDGRAEALRRRLAEAEEQARRAGVYPGTLRDIKRVHGLDTIR